MKMGKLPKQSKSYQKPYTANNVQQQIKLSNVSATDEDVQMSNFTTGCSCTTSRISSFKTQPQTSSHSPNNLLASRGHQNDQLISCKDDILLIFKQRYQKYSRTRGKTNTNSRSLAAGRGNLSPCRTVTFLLSIAIFSFTFSSPLFLSVDCSPSNSRQLNSIELPVGTYHQKISVGRKGPDSVHIEQADHQTQFQTIFEQPNNCKWP